MLYLTTIIGVMPEIFLDANLELISFFSCVYIRWQDCNITLQALARMTNLNFILTVLKLRMYYVRIVDTDTDDLFQFVSLRYHEGRLHGLSGSAVGHRSVAIGFKSRPGYVRRVFHVSLRLLTFVGRSAHLAYPVHKNGLKTATFYI